MVNLGQKKEMRRVEDEYRTQMNQRQRLTPFPVHHSLDENRFPG